MRKSRVSVSVELKEQVLSELSKAGSNIQLLAKQHNLSIKTIRGWKTDYNKQILRKKDSQHQNNQFIELTSLPRLNQISAKLKKVDLVFEDYSCSIVGKISSNQLLKLVQLLESGLC
jgi:transposase-like protein